MASGTGLRCPRTATSGATRLGRGDAVWGHVWALHPSDGHSRRIGAHLSDPGEHSGARSGRGLVFREPSERVTRPDVPTPRAVAGATFGHGSREDGRHDGALRKGRSVRSRDRTPAALWSHVRVGLTLVPGRQVVVVAVDVKVGFPTWESTSHDVVTAVVPISIIFLLSVC